MTETKEAVSPFRAWRYLVWLSITRQLRANLMLLISLGLLALSTLVIFATTQADRWSMKEYRSPRRIGLTYESWLRTVERTQQRLPWDPATNAILQAGAGGMRAMLAKASGFFVFSNTVVFGLFTTFLLPLWSLSFATEGIGREREAGNLIWILTRPLSRPGIFLAKFIAILPWSLTLNLGGFALLCYAGGSAGQVAFSAYWPAVVWGTLAFCGLFHLMGAALRRPAVVAILYSFFFETFFGNLSGHIKRLSISYYVRCMMYEAALPLGMQPANPASFVPVSAAFALTMLIGAAIVCVLAGMWVFARQEYLEEA